VSGDCDLECCLCEFCVFDEGVVEECLWDVVCVVYLDYVLVWLDLCLCWFLFVVVVGVVVFVIGFSLVGVKVGDLVLDVVGIGVLDVKLVFCLLLVVGELLVLLLNGVWLVVDDGFKWLFGNYDVVVWFFNNVYVVGVVGW